METLYLLIPVSVILVFLIGIAFWWSLRNGQFDDMEGPAYRILMDDDKVASGPSPGDAVPQTFEGVDGPTASQKTE
jgi:cbb3-type cytochrome oxidase maturation protein